MLLKNHQKEPDMCLRSLFIYYYVIVLHTKQSFTFNTICKRKLEHTWLHKPVDIGYLKQICNFKAVWHCACLHVSESHPPDPAIPIITPSLGTPTSHGPKVQK